MEERGTQMGAIWPGRSRELRGSAREAVKPCLLCGPPGWTCPLMGCFLGHVGYIRLSPEEPVFCQWKINKTGTTN